MARRFAPLACAGALLCILPAVALAQDAPPDLRQEIAQLKQAIDQLNQKLSAQDQKIKDLETALGAATPAPATAAAPAPATPPEPPPPPVPSATGAPQTSTYFNPAVSVIGNLLGVAGHNRVENLPSVDMREAEVGLQAIVDPYARADFFLSFAESGVELEEGYATFTSLPWGLLAKAGRFRSDFGKINTLHLHVLPWPDEPLPLVNLLGGEDGWRATGLSVSRMFPIGDTFTELTAEVSRGEADNLFSANGQRRVAWNTHYRVFRDLGESVNVDLGLSHADGPNETSDTARTRLDGVDLTLRWKPLATAKYRSATFRGEWMRSRREEPLGIARAEGWFGSLDWQLAQRWFLGARLDASDRSLDPTKTDRGKALVLTFWPSEFSQLRGELRRRVYAGGTAANEFLMQLQFAIGAHGAHPF